MYNDMYDTFPDKKFEYSYPFSFKSQNQPYLEMIDKAEICWNFGDEVLLQIPLEVYLNTGDYLNLKIYNFRYEEILSTDNVIYQDNILSYTVNKEESENLFLPNIYFYSIEIYNNSEKVGVVKEPSSKNFFYVK